MSLSIQYNEFSGIAAGNLATAFASLSKSTARLASGLRLNNASEDAASLAVSELIRTDVAALNQAYRNVNDAVSLVQSADEGLQRIDELLIRLIELAQQAASGTFTSDQRLILDTEYQQGLEEIQRIADATEFNGLTLLNGGLSGSHDGSGLGNVGPVRIQVDAGNDAQEDEVFISLGKADVEGLFGKDLVVAQLNTALQAALTNAQTAAEATAGLFYAPGSGFLQTEWWGDLAINDPVEGLLAGVPAFTPGDGLDAFIAYANAISANAQFQVTGPTALPFAQAQTILASSGSTFLTAFNLPASAQFGLSVSTMFLARQSMLVLEEAIASKDSIRGSLGAIQERLDGTVDAVAARSSSLNQAQRRIAELDVALELLNFARAQILTQQSTAVLAQANITPRLLLQLYFGDFDR